MAPLSTLRAEATVLATAVNRRVPRLGRSNQLRRVWFDLSYYSTSSPVRAKAAVLATAD